MRHLTLQGLVVLTLLLGGCGREEPPTQSPNQPTEQPPRQPAAGYQAPSEEPKGNPQAEAVAKQAADAWLALVDKADYGTSWEEAAQLFKASVTKEDWEKRLNTLRTSMGKVIARRLKSASYTTIAPGAPDGQYVIIEYNSSFENKRIAVETVTPMMDKDGKWRVSGYYFK